jgi:hypothetical protein
MGSRQFARKNGVERAEKVELLIVVGRGIAQNGYLDLHARRH